MTGSPAIHIFLDRDDTIIRDISYLDDPDAVEFLPHAIDGLQLMQKMGLRLVMVTNQSGIGRGLVSEDTVKAVHRQLEKMLAEQRIRLTAIYYCPHAPGQGCSCRKPETGLLEQAQADLGCSLEHSWMIGDKPSDIELGKRVGARTILIRSPVAGRTGEAELLEPDFVVDDLAQAAERIRRTIASDTGQCTRP